MESKDWRCCRLAPSRSRVWNGVRGVEEGPAATSHSWAAGPSLRGACVPRCVSAVREGLLSATNFLLETRESKEGKRMRVEPNPPSPWDAAREWGVWPRADSLAALHFSLSVSLQTLPAGGRAGYGASRACSPTTT